MNASAEPKTVLDVLLAAVARAEDMRAAEIAKLKRQITKLEELRF